MKMRSVVALVGLAISFALPALAQQKDTLDPQLRQVADALSKKFDEAYDNNDAAAVAALFTEDAVLCDYARTDLRSGGNRETLRRRVSESAFQQPCRQARSVIPSHYRYGWQ
jgi:hypothetical protein